jgi:hypothetical protein
MVFVSGRATNVPANTKNAEELQGTQLAFAPKDGILNLYATASAVGVRTTLMVGGEVVVDDQDISVQNRVPVRPDDLVHSVQVRAGEQLRLFFRNDTGGALNRFFICELL